MPKKSERQIRNWLLVVCIFVSVLVVFGGFVRLTRSGLSMVEWDVVTGVIPPIGEQAWQGAFEKYQKTPEFKIVNSTMSIEQYQRIYYIEYTHRVLGRLTGLVFVLPLFYFLLRSTLPIRLSLPYLFIGILFAFQGVLGWYMVQSGLINQPRVSQYRLTAHLVTALGILGLCFLMAMRNWGSSEVSRQREKTYFPRIGALVLFSLTLTQIAYGGLVAGLQAGFVSNTFPLMAGRLIPVGLFSQSEIWALNFFANPTTVHFIHRWLAFGVLGAAILLYYQNQNNNGSAMIQKLSLGIMVLIITQISLGVAVIWLRVPISLALIHQATGMLLFLTIIYLNYHIFNKAPKITAPERTPNLDFASTKTIR